MSHFLFDVYKPYFAELYLNPNYRNFMSEQSVSKKSKKKKERKEHFHFQFLFFARFTIEMEKTYFLFGFIFMHMASVKLCMVHFRIFGLNARIIQKPLKLNLFVLLDKKKIIKINFQLENNPCRSLSRVSCTILLGKSHKTGCMYIPVLPWNILGWYSRHTICYMNSNL